MKTLKDIDRYIDSISFSPTISMLIAQDVVLRFMSLTFSIFTELSASLSVKITFLTLVVASCPKDILKRLVAT